MYPNIFAEMARNSITREELAHKINMSLSTLRKKLKGEVPFNMDEILKLLSLFGRELTFEYLFERKN